MMKKKFSVLLSVLLVAVMLMPQVSFAANDVFQWLVEPSLTFNYVYYEDYDKGYWRLGDNRGFYDVVDSYGNVISFVNMTESEINTIGEKYISTIMDDNSCKVEDFDGNLVLYVPYPITGMCGDLFVYRIQVQSDSDWRNERYGLINAYGNIVVEAEYTMLINTGYNGWIICEKDNKYGILDRNGNVIYEPVYSEASFCSYFVACLNDPDGNNVIVDKETGKTTEFSGDADIFYTNFNWPCYETDELVVDGVFMNSKGEMLYEKTEALKNSISAVTASGKAKSVLNGHWQYCGKSVYAVTPDPDDWRVDDIYVTLDGRQIAPGANYVYEYAPGKFYVGYGDGRQELLDINGDSLIPDGYERIKLISERFVGLLDEENTIEYKGNNEVIIDIYDIETDEIIYSCINIMVENEYFLIQDMEGKIGFAKEIKVPDVDLTKSIILNVDEKDMYVYGKYQTIDAAPMIQNGRTMVPIRAVAEALGATVLWIGETNEVTIKSDDKDISIAIGSSEAVVNGKTVSIDSPAFVRNGRTYLPLRFVSENLGATVEWNNDTKSVVITK